MGISHPNMDVGAEADTHRESINQFDSLITKDEHNNENNTTTIEYIVGEGDPPFGKYRMTLELISTHSIDEYAESKDKARIEQAAE
jgi:hypothetical protein